MSTFGERFKQLRNEYDKTLDEMKDILHTTKSTLSHYENNHRTPKIDFARKAADYFNVSVDYIMGTSNYRNYEGMTHQIGAKSVEDVENEIYRKKLDELGISNEDIERLSYMKKGGLTLKKILDLVEYLKNQKLSDE